ncbi:hypothetical protein ACFY8W_13960 [Streptomyces sp. NPDC012637]|uniref:hypothetical protein n=1 Tax=Streptomyces sp. NPDC012637 TaxID=3364842 RepID=UPI0036E7E16F
MDADVKAMARRSGPLRATAAAAAAAVAVVLGAGGCAENGAHAGAGGPAAAGSTTGSTTARPEDSGPFTRERVRAELDASAAEAGAPPTDPDWAETEKEPAAPGSLGSCTVMYKAYGTDRERLDIPRYDAVAGELRDRDWKQAGRRKERKAKDGTVFVVQQVFKKRGWTLVSEFRGWPQTGTLSLAAFDEACLKRSGIDPDTGIRQYWRD